MADSGFDTNLDLDNLEHMSAAEADELLRWYEEAHGDGQGDLTPFVPFFIEHNPSALKLYRAYAQALDQDGGLPQLVVALLFLHYYMLRGNERGVLYEVVAARVWGATKREVLETIELTFVESGPLGGNAASLSSDYLKDWPDVEPRAVEGVWPEHWVRDEDPRTVDEDSATWALFNAHAPNALDALRRRWHFAQADKELPDVMQTFYGLHCAVADGRAEAAAQEAAHALRLGARPSEILEVVGFGALYSDRLKLEEVCRAVGSTFELAPPA